FDRARELTQEGIVCMQEDEIARMQTAQRYVLKSYRVLIVESDHGVAIVVLSACSLNSLKVLERAAIKLNAIGMGEIGDRVMPKACCEHKGVLSISSSEPVISIAADQAVIAISAEQEIIAAIAIQGFSTIAGSDDAGRIAAG